MFSKENNAAHQLNELLNQIHHQDALQLLKALPNDCIDMVLTDPPYSSGGLTLSSKQRPAEKKYSDKEKDVLPGFANEAMDSHSWYRWCITWLNEAFRVMKPGAYFISFIDWRQFATLTDAIQAAGIVFRGTAVWDKTPSRSRPRMGGLRQQAEFIVWGTKGSAALPKTVVLNGVFTQARSRQALHLTEKPLPVLEELIKLVQLGGVVLDPFAGSGTSLLAAKNAGLNWVGCEKNAKYFEEAKARLATSP